MTHAPRHPKSAAKPHPEKPAAKPHPEKAVVRKPWEAITARDVMKTEVVVVADTMPLSEVERVLSENRVGGAPVVDEAGAVIGVVSIRDLVERYTEDPDARPRRGAGFYELSSEELLDDDFESFEVPAESEETAADVMTNEVYWVRCEAGLAEMARAMTTHGVHRLLVKDGGKYVGLVTTTEILRALGA